MLFGPLGCEDPGIIQRAENLVEELRNAPILPMFASNPESSPQSPDYIPPSPQYLAFSPEYIPPSPQYLAFSPPQSPNYNEMLERVHLNEVES